MFEPCCTIMKSMTITPEEWRADPNLFEEGVDLADWTPRISWSDATGTLVMGNVAIFYCPWCGTHLPDRSEEALTEGRQSGTWVSVDSDGKVSAAQDGQPIDAEEWLAHLKSATDEQD
jgi:hypothetical protein